MLQTDICYGFLLSDPASCKNEEVYGNIYPIKNEYVIT